MHNTFETSSAEDLSPEEQAAMLINETTEQETKGGSVDPEVLATRIEIAAALLPEHAKHLVSTHTAGLQDLQDGAVIENLDVGVGGQFDGSVSIATDTILVDESGVGTAAERMAEVDAHEAYHAAHGHLDPLVMVDSGDSGTVVTIGGRAFDETTLTEAVTVAETGQEFVSDGYKAYVQDVSAAIAVSDVTYEQVRDALNNRNLAPVDDETVRRENAGAGKLEPALAS